MADSGSLSSNHTREIPQTGSGPLDPIFAPRTVAMIGATERAGSMGRTVLENLAGGPFGGAAFPVNPKRSSVLRLKCYPSIGSVPQRVDLAVIATPAPTVPDLLGACAEAGVRGAVILSAGFKESGLEGAELDLTVECPGPPEGNGNRSSPEA